MQDHITLANNKLAAAAFIEGGVSPEYIQDARDLTEQRKSGELTTNHCWSLCRVGPRLTFDEHNVWPR